MTDRLTEEQLSTFERRIGICIKAGMVSPVSPQDTLLLLAEVRRARKLEPWLRHDKHCHLCHEHLAPGGCPFSACPGCSCGLSEALGEL